MSVAVIHLVLADAISKEIAAGCLKGAAAIPVVPNLFDLAYVQNRGCAWGLFQGQVWPLAVFGVLALGFLMWKRKSVFGAGKVAAVSECLLYAGIVGNLIDRIAAGKVIDMICVPWFSTFNVADIFITVGAVLLVLYILIFDREFLSDKKEKDHDKQSDLCDGDDHPLPVLRDFYGRDDRAPQ